MGVGSVDILTNTSIPVIEAIIRIFSCPRCVSSQVEKKTKEFNLLRMDTVHVKIELKVMWPRLHVPIMNIRDYNSLP